MNDGTLLTPLTIILAFIGVIEATLAYRVTSLAGKAQLIFVWFMVTFPALVLAGFFYIQITNPLSWYPPSELDKTTIERLNFLYQSPKKLIGVQLLDETGNAISKTFGEVASLPLQALTLYEQGMYKEALALFEAAIKQESQTSSALPSSPFKIAAIQVNIGTTLSTLERYEEALVWFKKALKQYRSVGGHAGSVAIVLNNLGIVYSKLGRLGEALTVFQEALEILENTLGEAHPDTAITLNNLASMYAEQGNLAQSLEFFERALVINEKTLGPDDPRTATSINNLASIYSRMGHFDEALTLYRRALTIMESALGPLHPSTKIIRGNVKYIEGKTEG